MPTFAREGSIPGMGLILGLGRLTPNSALDEIKLARRRREAGPNADNGKFGPKAVMKPANLALAPDCRHKWRLHF
jgi:hypothetical protein